MRIVYGRTEINYVLNFYRSLENSIITYTNDVNYSITTVNKSQSKAIIIILFSPHTLIS